MLYIGLLAGVVAGNCAAHATGTDAFRVFTATFLLLPPALAGARLLHVASHWKDYKETPRRIWNRSEGGLAMYGALPVMLLVSVPVLAALGVGFGAFWDAASFTILTGIAITKIGCLLNGCCAGRPSRSWFAFTLPDVRGVREKRIPVQCLEAAWAVVVLGVACALLGRLPFPGALFLSAAVIYSAGRLALEALREPEPSAGKIAAGTAAALLTAISGTVLLVMQWPQ